MYVYQGCGVMPEVPGAPMRDLTNEEYERLAARLGVGALSGVYTKQETRKAAASKPATDEKEQD